jgi:pilus assembly protein Flp/PilA
MINWIKFRILKALERFREEDGAGLAEYALLLVLIAVVCIVALTALGGSISSVFTEISTELGG